MRQRRTLMFPIALLALLLAGCSSRSPTPARTGPEQPPATAEASATATPRADAGSPPPGAAPERSFGVGVRTLRLNRGGDRPLPVTVWYPADGGSARSPERDADVADGRFPVVLFSHGLTGLPADYRALVTPWAAAGFVVAAPAYPHTSRGAADSRILDVINQPADASYVLTEVLARNTRAGDPLRGRLATDQVAAAGHSAGGITTIGLFTTGRDERLDAGIVFAGSALGVGTAFSGQAAPQLFVHGERDEVVSYAAGKAVFDAVPWPKAMLSLPESDHGRDLLRDGNPALRVVTDTTVEFLRWTLYGDAAARQRMPGDAARGGLAQLDDQL